jgi:hypothetical protein
MLFKKMGKVEVSGLGIGKQEPTPPESFYSNTSGKYL